VKRSNAALLDRREVVAAVLHSRGDSLLVTGLGSPTYDAAAVGEHPLHFSLWGGMGGAAMVGLGLALAQPSRRVLVLTGDGEMLMGLGSLATIGVSAPRNLGIIVIDNERYGETGMQPTHTASGVDLAGIARAASFPVAGTIREQAELESWIPMLYQKDGPIFAAVKVSASQPAASLRPQDGTEIHYRFRAALLASSQSRPSP
jgi:thiamine pyrophosphate-dependent acetolactate synthase large subunit-like protein